MSNPNPAPAAAPSATPPRLVPLVCRATSYSAPRAREVDLVGSLEKTPEGPLARVSIVHGGPLNTVHLWFTAWELQAFLLELAELQQLQGQPS